MKKKTNSLLLFFSLALFFVLFQSNRAGRPGAWAAAPGDSGVCATCHTSAGSGNIALTGAPAVYAPGTTYNMTLTLTDATALVGGFQIVATNGTTNALVGAFTPAAGQRLNDINRLVQDDAAPFAGGSVSWPISWTAPATGGPANIQFYFAGNAANNNFNNGAGDKGYSSSSALISVPVELMAFELEASDKAVTLTWATASEITSSHFTIEQSTDGRNFEAIGKVEATGSAYETTSYTYTDEQAAIGKTNYYRLLMEDEDGQYEYSSLRSIHLESLEDRRLKVYPNPVLAGEVLNIDIAEIDRNTAVDLSVFNALGQQVYFQQIDRAESMPLQMPLLDLAPGIYFVRLSDDRAVLGTERLILE